MEKMKKMDYVPLLLLVLTRAPTRIVLTLVLTLTLTAGISLVDNINNTKPTKQTKVGDDRHVGGGSTSVPASGGRLWRPSLSFSFSRSSHPSTHAQVFFVTPTDANIALLTSRHKHSSDVHVFFTTAPSPFQIEDIKKSGQLLSHLVTLKEANVEYVMNPDARGFTTGPEDALERFYGHGAELLPEYDEGMYQIANRLASLFVTMKEMPSIRYRAALPPDSHEYPHGLESRLLVTQRLAVELSTLLEHHQEANQIPEGTLLFVLVAVAGSVLRSVHHRLFSFSSLFLPPFPPTHRDLMHLVSLHPLPSPSYPQGRRAS